MGLLYQKMRAYIYKVICVYAKVYDTDDLMQESYIALFEAVEKYDFSRGANFATFAGFYIKKKINRYVNNMIYPQKIPRYLMELIPTYRKFVNEYRILHKGSPSDKECIEHLGITEKRFRNLLKVIDTLGCASLDKALPDVENVALVDTISDNFELEEYVINNISEVQANNDILRCVNELNTKFRNVIVSRYYDNLSVLEVSKLYKLSRNQVKDIESRALLKLKNEREIQEIGDIWFRY